MRSELNIAGSSGTELPMNAFVIASPDHIARLDGAIGNSRASKLNTIALASGDPVPFSVMDQAEMLVLEIDPESEASLARMEQVRRARPNLPLLAAV